MWGLAPVAPADISRPRPRHPRDGDTLSGFRTLAAPVRAWAFPHPAEGTRRQNPEDEPQKKNEGDEDNRHHQAGHEYRPCLDRSSP